ncbi:MAG: SGNH/GDSL hydrolase family protein [Lachnospiraceae bacterium]|nr:SGNH/GDSL hydrolase family protein [Lachnospiraceae bacterium]
MKKLLIALIVVLNVVVLSACGDTQAQGMDSETVASPTQSLDQEKEIEEKKEENAAIPTPSPKTAVSVKKPAETTGKDESVSDNSIVADVDMSRIEMFENILIMYAQTNLNLRKGPSTEYETIGSVRTNDEIKVKGRYGKEDWFLIDNNGTDAFVSSKFLSEEKIDLEALKKEQEAAALAAIEAQRAQNPVQTENPVQPEPQPANPQPASPPAGILFIGDSRCVQMQAAVGGGNSSWICENSKGYEWFSSTAVGQADQCVGKGTKVVICLGVNDTDNISNYAALVNAKAAEWAKKGAKTYFVSVNPVTENPYRTEEEVEAFNAALPGQLSGVRWIDTHSFLTSQGYVLVDGLHYDTNTYVAIFNAIVGSLK